MSAKCQKQTFNAFASSSTSAASIEKEPSIPLSLISDADAEKKRAAPGRARELLGLDHTIGRTNAAVYSQLSAP